MKNARIGVGNGTCTLIPLVCIIIILRELDQAVKFARIKLGAGQVPSTRPILSHRIDGRKELRNLDRVINFVGIDLRNT